MRKRVKAKAAAVGTAAAIATATMTGCQTQPCQAAEPICVTTMTAVVAQVDASPSTPHDDLYWKRFVGQVEQMKAQPLRVDVMALGATADPTEVCPTLKGDVVQAEPGADNQELSWTRSARKLVSDSKVVFDCAKNAASTPGSTVLSFEQARGADQLWLFTDGMFNSADLDVRAKQLDDPAYVQDVIANLPQGDALTGVGVHVYGAGVNRGLSNEQMAGLRQVFTAAVEAQGGTLVEWVTL